MLGGERSVKSARYAEEWNARRGTLGRDEEKYSGKWTSMNYGNAIIKHELQQTQAITAIMAANK